MKGEICCKKVAFLNPLEQLNQHVGTGSTRELGTSEIFILKYVSQVSKYLLNAYINLKLSKMIPRQARLPPFSSFSCVVFYCLILASHLSCEILIFLSCKGDTISEARQGQSASSNQKKQVGRSKGQDLIPGLSNALSSIHSQLIYEPRPP